MDLQDNYVTIFATSFLMNDNSLILSNSESSSSDESDISIDEEIDESILYGILMIGNTRGENIQREILMFPETYEIILNLIGPCLSQTNLTGRKQIHPGKQLLITLWFLATPDSYRSIHVQFGVGKATAFRAVRRVTYALHCIAPRFIKWPEGDSVNNTVTEFSKLRGFPKVIGSLDGSFIRIKAPKEDSASYVCRKQFHAIQLQAVCNAKSIFTHCYAGHVGSVHDARIFRNSPLAEYIAKPSKYFPSDTHIIADAAYAIHPNVMVPFRDNGHLTAHQKNYNFVLSSTRMTIERAFGLLKVRFRILLDCLPLTDVKKIPQVIIACCVLHNICMQRNDDFPIAVCASYENIIPDTIGNGAELGNIKRNRIMNELRIYNRN
ncbi:putative nuclease HARBI1 [Prorops nasuta]|uniref:putative nuclease HARBI1 n=1 Tax=Prorops nasuta TaxID=863751 RepID=UPI0034CFE2ED